LPFLHKCEKIWKMRKKSRLNCEMIWKIRKKGKLKSEKGVAKNI
jgi:hypothetical protein